MKGWAGGFGHGFGRLKMGGWNVGAMYSKLTWFSWMLLRGLRLGASASAEGLKKGWSRSPAKFHKAENRIVLPESPPKDFSAEDGVKLVLEFERSFPVKSLHLAWN